MLDYIILGVTTFLLGLILGWSVESRLKVTPKDVRLVVAFVMLAIYLVSVLAEIQMDTYETPMLLHAIMGGLVGYLFSQGDGFAINIGQKPGE